MAPSISQGSCKPSGASAATSVVFLPWVRGTELLARRSGGAQPYQRVKEIWLPLASTKTRCSGSRWATALRQAVRASSSRTARLPVSFVLRPSSPADRPPHRRFTQLLTILLRPPGAVLQHRGVRSGLQPRAQRRLLPGSNAPWIAGNGLALQRARLALVPHRAFDCIHADAKAARGFSHGLTLSHRSHQAFLEVGRIGSHTVMYSTSHAWLCFLQVALVRR